jgi:hypothetical protein
MAHLAGKTVGASTDFTLGPADGGTGVVSRWRMHVTQVTGTITIKATAQGTGTGTVAAATPVAAAVVTTIGSTTAASTITATGLYDLDATGLVLVVSVPGGATITFDAVQLLG